MTLGEKIAEIRIARGWTQRELARRAMVHHQIISELEGNRQLDTYGQIIRRLALVLHVSTDYLIGMYDEL